MTDYGYLSINAICPERKNIIIDRFDGKKAAHVFEVGYIFGKATSRDLTQPYSVQLWGRQFSWLNLRPVSRMTTNQDRKRNKQRVEAKACFHRRIFSIDLFFDLLLNVRSLIYLLTFLAPPSDAIRSRPESLNIVQLLLHHILHLLLPFRAYQKN